MSLWHQPISDTRGSCHLYSDKKLHVAFHSSDGLSVQPAGKLDNKPTTIRHEQFSKWKISIANLSKVLVALLALAADLVVACNCWKTSVMFGNF